MVCYMKNLEEFNAELSKGKPVVVDFTASWCPPCKMIAPKFEAMAGEFTGAIFVKVDVDEAPDISEEQGISAMPTFMVFKDGKKVGELVGASEEKLRALIASHCS